MIPVQAASSSCSSLQPVNTLPQPILGRIYNAVTNFFKELAGKIFTFFTAASNKLKECFAARRITAQSTGAPAPASSTQQVATSSQVKSIRRVPLTNASQYDMQEQLPAGAFHAICAIKEISNNFSQVFGWLQTNNTQALSKFQRDIILTQGIPFYKQALERNPRIQERADFEHIAYRLHPDADFKLASNEDIVPFEERLTQLVDALTSAPHKAAWVKNGNEESFAVVVSEQKAIIFDSHKNEMIGIHSPQQLTAVLDEKLRPFANITEWGDGRLLSFSPFAYAVSR